MDQRPLLSGQPLSPSTILSERTQCSSAAPCLFSASIFNNSTAKNQNRIYEPEKPEKNPLVGATVHLKGKMGEKKITTVRLLFFFFLTPRQKHRAHSDPHLQLCYGSTAALTRTPRGGSDPPGPHRPRPLPVAPSRLPAASPGAPQPPGPGSDLCDGGGRAAAKAPPRCPTAAGAGPAEQAARRERPGFRRGAHPPPGGGGEGAPGPHGGEGDGRRGAAGPRGGNGALGR